MARVNAVNTDKAPQEVKQIYQDLQKQLGRVPNIFLNMGNSAAVLNAYLNVSQAADQTSLNPKLREQIALIVSQVNNCQYCLSAHTAIGKGAGLVDQDILLARQGQAKDPKTQAILKFTRTVVEKKGRVDNQDVISLKEAGVTDQELVEIILVIVQTIFTNYFNHITDPEVDFPAAPSLN